MEALSGNPSNEKVQSKLKLRKISIMGRLESLEDIDKEILSKLEYYEQIETEIFAAGEFKELI